MYLSKSTVKEDTPKPEAVPQTDQRKPSPLKQWWIFMRRTVMTKITNTQYLAITLM
jgi:hypothetical protein